MTNVCQRVCQRSDAYCITCEKRVIVIHVCECVINICDVCVLSVRKYVDNVCQLNVTFVNVV